ncbi:MAG TPA: pyridoxal phosphate-dependent aminotransferase [Sediminispirochaeta sp.]|nr:pyridoxal phosphate-dependent aminotransferase [Sediminispirochaeta sp.]
MKHETKTPIKSEIVREKIAASGIKDFGRASIRELVRLVYDIEAASGDKFIRMEMGVPGLAPPEIGIEAQVAALRQGVASKYSMIDGLPQLKKEASRFAKLFLNVDIKPESCVPTVGSMQGGFVTFMVANRNNHNRKGTLFIDPGFPVQKQQCHALGHEYESFDVYHYRGEKLRDKLESYLQTEQVSSILYSNPNNPTWICLTEEELRIIGELSQKYDVTVIEDLAYFGMDFRHDYSRPGEPPYQPTVAHYTDNYVLMLSTSKAFSYAGERLGLLLISDALFKRRYPDLLRYYDSDQFGHALIYGALYTLSSGTGHSAQYAVAAMLKAVNDGEFNFVEQVKEYQERAQVMKKLMLDNGFRIVYDKDDGHDIADGFYFTFAYPGFSAGDLVEELLYYGISAISLEITGSEHHDGLRACVSQFSLEMEEVLKERLERFHADHR